MKLKVRALKLRVMTDKGPVGATIPFDDGLCILRANNTSGKSTCMQAIIYALGLEGMLSAAHDVPLPHAMTERVEIDGEDRVVLESEVILEIANGDGRIWTIARSVKGGFDRHLVRTWDGAAITGRGPFAQRDFYVRHPGAATRELGFHHELASFIGWTLPSVGKYDGSVCPLYLECVFPMMLIEQKRGWSAIQARMPLHYRIREVGKRAVEFILRMDAQEIAMKRQRLSEVVGAIRGRWSALLKELQELAAGIGAIIQGLPPAPTSTWPPAVQPQFIVAVGGEWQPLRRYLANQRARLSQLEATPVASVKEQTRDLEQGLAREEERAAVLDAALKELFENVRREEAQLTSIKRKLAALEDDLRRNQDVVKLRKLGSVLDLSVSKLKCPTCHQNISDALLPQEGTIRPMAVDDNIDFIKDQMAAYRAVLANTSTSLEAKSRQLVALRSEVADARRKVRSLKSSLSSDERAPSEAAVQERIRLRDRVERETGAADRIELLLVRFGELAAEWRAVDAELNALPADDLSDNDRAKLAALERLVQDQAAEFGLSSVAPKSLGISRDVYRPVHEGFDLEFDLSASDMIRTIWAYLLSMLELSRRFHTNHAKLLVLDEPRQQDTARLSFGAFLRRASHAAEYGEQIIFATSEELDTLSPLLEGIPHTMHLIKGKVLKALS
ncbi:hypothetical protein WMF38_51840 [Sorangium sp. So ce118]